MTTKKIPVLLIIFIAVGMYAASVRAAVDDRWTASADIVYREVLYDTARGSFLLTFDGAIPLDALTLGIGDTLFLVNSDTAMYGLTIYDEITGEHRVDTFVGPGYEYAHAASEFGIGNFILITTTLPGQCDSLSLDACRAQPTYSHEAPLLVR